MRRCFEAAERLEILDIARLTVLCATSPGRKGIGRLRSLVADHRPLPVTRSELERMFLRLCDRHGIPRPAVNVPVAGFEVDCVWMDARLVVELDGWGFHRGRAAFEADRRRDAALQLAGYRVLRVTHRRLAREPDRVAAELRSLLATGAHL